MKKSIFAVMVCFFVFGCAKNDGSTNTSTQNVVSTAQNFQEITAGMSTEQMKAIIFAKAKSVVAKNVSNLSSAFANSDTAELERQKALIVKEKECVMGNTASCVEAGNGFSGDYENAMTFYQAACVLKDTNGCTAAATLYAKNKAQQTSPALGYLLDSLCGSGMSSTCNLLK